MRNSIRSTEISLPNDARTDVQMKRITTERLTLDVIREVDFDALITLFKDEMVSNTYMVPYMPSLEDEKRLFTSILQLSRRQDQYVYGIFLTNRLIGIINDTEISGKEIELGYALNPKYFSMGYMTEALRGLITHLFDQGFERVICGAFDHNASSIRVMEKCGMSKMSKVEDIEYRGTSHKCIYYSISRK